jgi:hypothetical protein
LSDRQIAHSLLHGRRELGSLLNRQPPVAAMPSHSPVQHLGDMPHLTSGLSVGRQRPTSSSEVAAGDAERLREVLTRCARKKFIGIVLGVQKGALHDLADHHNIEVARRRSPRRS